MAPHIANFLLGSFGIVAAILLVGGSVMLRSQQNRHRFELAKQAMATGVPLPPPEPLWKGLQRQANSILAVGVGLILVGAVAWGVGFMGSLMTIHFADSDYQQERAVQAATAAKAPGERPGRPVPPSPQMEAWRSAQERVAVGQTAVGCGVILTLLGLARRSAAKTERASTEPVQSV